MNSPDTKWLRASLRLSGDELDLDQVTGLLGLKPDFSGRKGEHIGGKPWRAVYESNLWGFDGPDELHEPFQEQLQVFVARLEERGDVLRAITRRAGVSAELLLGYGGSGQGWLRLPKELLARIAALGLDVSLDLYLPEAQA